MLIAKEVVSRQTTGSFGQPITSMFDPNDKGPSNLKWPCKQCKKPNQVSVRHHLNGIACATCRSRGRYEQSVASRPKEPNMLGMGKGIGKAGGHAFKYETIPSPEPRVDVRPVCSCGWKGKPCRTAAGAQAQHSNHVRDDVQKSKFSRLAGKIERKEGYSKDTADKIAAAAGRRSIGAHAMAVRAARSRRTDMGKAAAEHAFQNNRTPDGGKFKPECSCGWSGRPCHTMYGSYAQHSNHVRDAGGLQKGDPSGEKLQQLDEGKKTCLEDHPTKPVWCTRPAGHKPPHKAQYGSLTVQSWHDEGLIKAAKLGKNRYAANDRAGLEEQAASEDEARGASTMWPCKQCGKPVSATQRSTGACANCAAAKPGN